jgi:thymidylate kinase
MRTPVQEADFPEVIYIMGIDGSGKTTVSEHIAEVLRSKGYKVEVRWLRFNHVISKPLLGLCRLLKLTRYENIDGVRVGYHEFYRSPFIAWLFIFLQYLDAVRATRLHVNTAKGKAHQVLILDRFVYDILIDLMIDTRIDKLDQTWIGRKLIALIPERSIIIPVVRSVAELLEARPESRVDRNFHHRLKLYEQLVERQSLPPLVNNSSLDHLLQSARQRIGVSCG